MFYHIYSKQSPQSKFGRKFSRAGPRDSFSFEIERFVGGGGTMRPPLVERSAKFPPRLGLR